MIASEERDIARRLAATVIRRAIIEGKIGPMLYERIDQTAPMDAQKLETMNVSGDSFETTIRAHLLEFADELARSGL